MTKHIALISMKCVDCLICNICKRMWSENLFSFSRSFVNFVRINQFQHSIKTSFKSTYATYEPRVYAECVFNFVRRADSIALSHIYRNTVSQKKRTVNGSIVIYDQNNTCLSNVTLNCRSFNYRAGHERSLCSCPALYAMPCAWSHIIRALKMIRFIIKSFQSVNKLLLTNKVSSTKESYIEDERYDEYDFDF